MTCKDGDIDTGEILGVEGDDAIDDIEDADPIFLSSSYGVSLTLVLFLIFC